MCDMLSGSIVCRWSEASFQHRRAQCANTTGRISAAYWTTSCIGQKKKEKGFEETQTPTWTQNAPSGPPPPPQPPSSASIPFSKWRNTLFAVRRDSKKLWIKISPASIRDIYTHPSHTLKVQESWPLTDPALSAARDQNFKNRGTLPAYVNQPQTPLNNLRVKMTEYKLENINCPNEVPIFHFSKYAVCFTFN